MTTEDKGKLFNFFIPLFTRLCCCILHNERYWAKLHNLQCKNVTRQIAKVIKARIYLNLFQRATLWHKPESTRTSLRADTNLTLPCIYVFCIPRQQRCQTAITNVFPVYFLATFVFQYTPTERKRHIDTRLSRAKHERHELTQNMFFNRTWVLRSNKFF